MNNNQIYNTRYLSRDVKRYLTNYAKAYATIASDDLVSAAQKFVNAFYKDYPNPKIYDRTFDFRDHSYQTVFEKTSSGCKGGVLLTWKDMSPYVKSWNGKIGKDGTVKGYNTIDPSFVWEAALNGYHGPENSPRLPKIMSPSPKDLITKYFNEHTNLNNNKYKTYAKKYADSQKYNTFGF